MAAGLWVRAELCVPPRADAVQVLVAPAASNHRYWDPTIEPEHISYRRAANASGFATLVVDPVGSMFSAQPLSARVRIEEYVDHVHALVGMLRAGQLGGHAFTTVITNGLSNSSLVSVLEAAKYHDVDAVILTGYSSPVNGANLAMESAREIEPASAEAGFAARGLDPGYIAFKRDFYERVLLSPDGYDPAVRAAVFETQDTWTSEYGMGIGLGVGRATTAATVSPARTINVPLLLALGSEDELMCGAPPSATDCTSASTVRSTNAPFFAASPRFDTFVLPRAGHAMNLAINAPDWFSAAMTWAHVVTE